MWKPIDALVSLSKMWISTAYCFSEIKSILPEEEPANASPHPVFSSIPHPTHTGSLSTPWFRIRKTIFPIVWLGSWWPNSSFLQSLLKSSWSTSEHNLCKQWSCAYFLEARVQGITSPSPLTGFTSKVKFTRNGHVSTIGIEPVGCAMAGPCTTRIWINEVFTIIITSAFLWLSEEHFCRSLNKHLTPPRKESRLCGRPLGIRGE